MGELENDKTLKQDFIQAAVNPLFSVSDVSKIIGKILIPRSKLGNRIEANK